MKLKLKHVKLRQISLCLASAALLTLAGCGGSPGGTAAAPEVTSQDVVTRVVDGPISNALVCLDKNGNGVCDTGEPSGRTDASGNLTLKIAKADVGKFALVTEVGTDAVDTVEGPVTSPFVMTSTPGKPGVLSPLTTMVVQAMQNGLTEDQAVAQIQNATTLSVNLFEDFTKVAPPAGGPKPGDVARMIVLSTQAQNEALKTSIGGQAIDGSTITGNDLRKAVAKNIFSLLPALAAAINDNSSGGTVDKTAVLNAVKTSFMTDAAVKTQVALANQAVVPDAPAAITASFSLDKLNFTDSSNWNRRTFNSSLAQNTPNADGYRTYIDRKEMRVNGGPVVFWNFGGFISVGQSDLFWDGKTWATHTLNFPSLSTVPDVLGNNSFKYGQGYSGGSGKRAAFDVSGKKMADVYKQIVDAGYTSLSIANAVSALGTATFPANSKVVYIDSTTTESAPAYYPGTGNQTFKYSADLATGGDSRTQAAGVGCNAPEFQNSPALAAGTLEALVAAYKGLPCLYNQGSLVSGANTFYEGGAQNALFTSAAWGNSTLSISTVGSVNVGGTPTAFYTGNKILRLGFQGTGSNAVTYYSCEQRFINGSSRACKTTGTGTYTITTLTDGSRTMTFSNHPAYAGQNTDRVFVERNGKVYFGYKGRLATINNARLNTEGANALFTQLGLPTNNPEVPMAFTSTSYQGTWDVRPATQAFAFNVGNGLFLNSDGTVSCVDRSNNTNVACSVTFSDATTGAFSGSDATGSSYSGIFDLVAGTITGTFNVVSQNLINQPFVGQRR